MDDLQWFDFLRMGTATFLFLALYFSGRRAVSRWDVYTVRDRNYWWAFNALMFWGFEGSLEAIIADAEWGPRTLLGFMVSIVCLLATAAGSPENIGEPTQDKDSTNG